MELRLPEDKLGKLKELVVEWRKKKLCSKKKLQSLLEQWCRRRGGGGQGGNCPPTFESG